MQVEGTCSRQWIGSSMCPWRPMQLTTRIFWVGTPASTQKIVQGRVSTLSMAKNLTLKISLQGYSESKLENRMGFEKAAEGKAKAAAAAAAAAATAAATRASGGSGDVLEDEEEQDDREFGWDDKPDEHGVLHYRQKMANGRMFEFRVRATPLMSRDLRPHLPSVAHGLLPYDEKKAEDPKKKKKRKSAIKKK